MDVCKQCGKDLVHAEGRRKKTFCNDTCRSNFWYDQNVKGKPKTVVKDLTQPTNKVEPPKQPATNYTADTKTPNKNFGQLLNDARLGIMKDEELKWANVTLEQRDLLIRKNNENK